MLRRKQRRPAPAAKAPRSSFVFEPLEQRVLLSADPFLFAGMIDIEADHDVFVRAAVSSEVLHDEVEVRIDAPAIRPPMFAVTEHIADVDEPQPKLDTAREPVATESDLTPTTDGLVVSERDDLVDEPTSIEQVDERPAMLGEETTVEQVGSETAIEGVIGDGVNLLIDGLDVQADAPQPALPDALVLLAPEGVEQGVDFALADLTLLPIDDAPTSGDLFAIDPIDEFERVEVMDASHLELVGSSAGSESGPSLHIDPLASLLRF
jgi:hypothetical protein